jgi:phytoene dehydrogenase-like protein
MSTSHRTVADAVVIGAGPNGLVAANALVDASWDVVVLEAQPEVGGAVRSAAVTAPGFVTDLFSAFYPLAAASPLIRDLDLGAHGLRWVQAPTVLAHVLADGSAAVLERDAARTAAGLDAFALGDGDAWLRLVEGWQRIRDPLLDALFTNFPPVRPGLRLLARLGTADALRLARLAATPVRRLGEEEFAGSGGRLLLTGNAMHSDIPPNAAGSGLFGWLLAMLGQDVGFPVPAGGAGRLAAALADRASAGGVELRTGAEVTAVLTRSGRAVGVRLADGSVVEARRAVLADVTAPALYTRLLDPAAVPPRLLDDLRRFEWDHATLKVNWALDSPVPWLADAAGRAGTVHLGVDLDGFVDFSADLTVRRRPARPFVLFGQMTTADASRSPAGTESAWAYTHLPAAVAARPAEVDDHVELVQAAVERVAPGFAAHVLARHVQTPRDLEAANASLAGGALNAGTSAIHQELVFRPTPGLGRPETPIEGLFLAGASAHPGGGVHGACGWNAARAALSASGRLGAVHRALLRTAWRRVLGE